MKAYSFMNRLRSLSLFAALLFSVIIFPKMVKAQDSLTNYLISSAQNNPALKSSYHQYRASLEMIPQVGSLPDPEMTFGVFITPNEQLMGNQTADIKFMQMFPWFGTLTTAKNEAAQMARARFQEFSEARNRLFFDVTSLYYQLYKLEKERSLAEKNLKYLKSYEQLALVRYSTASGPSSGSNDQSSPSSPVINPGSATQDAMNNKPQQGMSQGGAPMPKGKGMVDVLGVQLEINDLVNTIASLKDQKTPLISAFNAYLNRPLNSTVSLPDTLTPMKIDTTFKVLTDSIVSNNPMLRMYAAEEESYKTKIEKTRLMGLPMFGFGFDYMLISKRSDVMGSGNGRDMIMPMVNLTLPIYRKKYTSMRKEAEYLMNASKDKQANVRNNLQVDLQTALLNLKNAERKITLYTRQSSIAFQSLNVLTASYSTAGLDLEEVLRMQQKLIDYRYKLVEAVVEQNSAVANISYLISKKVVTDDYLTTYN